LEETIIIADELGIKHPTDHKNGEPIVMTTDFLLTLDKGQGVFEVARTIKMKDELLKERVLEKFEIEREYWQRRDIDWVIVTEEDIPKTMARNISYIYDYYDIRDFDSFSEMNGQHIEDLAMALLQQLIHTKENIRTVTSTFDKEVHLPLGSSLTLFYHLLAQKVIKVNMLEPINIEQSIYLDSINEMKLEQVRYG
jgi:hypothetical protein